MKPSMRHPEWINKLFAAIDARNGDAFASFITANGRFKFGNAPAVVGQGEIAKAVDGFFSLLSNLEHEVRDVWMAPKVMVIEGQATYTLKDGRVFTLPFCNVFDMEGEKVADYRIYADTSPLFSKA
ncbi:MAG: nuclear transport factor 2 family protein [Myxococcales bacterium]